MDDGLDTPVSTQINLETAYPEIGFDQWITLRADPSHSLNWTEELTRARAVVQEGKKIVWTFDLGLESPYFPLEDELRFQSIALGLKQFTETVWKEFSDHTIALSLYRGTADFASHFYWTERQEQNFSEWLEGEEKSATAQNRRLFAADAYAIYFQMLSHRLPDEVPIFLLFDLGSFSSCYEALQVVSKQRFEHFVVARKKEMGREGFVWSDEGVRYKTIDTRTGIVFPESGDCRESFDALLSAYPDGKIVFETFLTEEWEELDRLVVLDGSLSLQGKRKLQGFIAAGGEVIVA